jgi:beta-lactam-binding protein with PASTA domain
VSTAYGDLKGRITSQKPEFGAVLPAGSKVDLVVSGGPKG